MDQLANQGAETVSEAPSGWMKLSRLDVSGRRLEGQRSRGSKLLLPSALLFECRVQETGEPGRPVPAANSEIRDALLKDQCC